jgi:hypothetical protein
VLPANVQVSLLYTPAFEWVVPLRLRRLVRSVPPTPVAVPLAVCALPSYVTVYGFTVIDALALWMVSVMVPLALW